MFTKPVPASVDLMLMWDGTKYGTVCDDLFDDKAVSVTLLAQIWYLDADLNQLIWMNQRADLY